MIAHASAATAAVVMIGAVYAAAVNSFALQTRWSVPALFGALVVFYAMATVAQPERASTPDAAPVPTRMVAFVALLASLFAVALGVVYALDVSRGVLRVRADCARARVRRRHVHVRRALHASAAGELARERRRYGAAGRRRRVCRRARRRACRKFSGTGIPARFSRLPADRVRADGRRASRSTRLAGARSPVRAATRCRRRS